MPTKQAGKSRKPRKSRTQPATSKQVLSRNAAADQKRAAAKVQAHLRRVTPLVDLGKIWPEVFPFLPLEFRIAFRRPDDLLVCDFIFDNLKLETGGTARLVRRNPAKTATLIVELPPQSFGEQAFLEATGPVNEKFPETSPATKPKNESSPGESLGPLPLARIRMSGRSRVAFAMPAAEAELAFTLEAILDACRRWPMRLNVNAAPDRDTRLIDEFKHVDAFSKRWLAEIQAGGTWKRTAQSLVDALGGGTVQKALAAGAERIARMAASAASGAVRETEATIRAAMNDELDALSARYAPLQDEARREVALAALSLLTTDALAKTKGELTAEVLKAFPFLPIVFAPHQPSPVVTALELPYRIILSPIPHSNWWHRIMPVTRNSRTELWHTRLTQTTHGRGPDAPTKVRALWSPDYRPEPDDPEIVGVTNGVQPYRMSLDAMDRLMLVKLMSDFTEPNFMPRAARAERLTLSALGAICDIEGRWKELPVGVGLEQWRHLATLGRDQYVRVVYRGSLCELGHAASLIKVTERKFETLPGSGKSVAVLRQRFFIVVTEPVKSYSGIGHEFHGHNFPFTSVEILTRVTPNLLDPGNNACKLAAGGVNPSAANDAIYGTAPGGGATPHRACFWPMLGPNNDFQFQIAGTDVAGTVHTFSMPLLFVGKEANDRASVMTEVRRRYNDDFNKGRRTTSLGNSIFCFAPPDEDAEGDPRLPTTKMVFGAGKVSGLPAKDPKYYPEIELATVGIAAIQRLLQQPDAVVDVTYTETYKKNGFGGANAGEVFLKTVEPFSLDFGNKVKSDTLGGLATPSMAIQGLSRIMGPVAAQPPSSPTPASIEQALAKVIANTFNPGDFFKGAKILGGVDLSKILGIRWCPNLNCPSPLAWGFLIATGFLSTASVHGVLRPRTPREPFVKSKAERVICPPLLSVLKAVSVFDSNLGNQSSVASHHPVQQLIVQLFSEGYEDFHLQISSVKIGTLKVIEPACGHGSILATKQNHVNANGYVVSGQPPKVLYPQLHVFIVAFSPFKAIYPYVRPLAYLQRFAALLQRGAHGVPLPTVYERLNNNSGRNQDIKHVLADERVLAGQGIEVSRVPDHNTNQKESTKSNPPKPTTKEHLVLVALLLIGFFCLFHGLRLTILGDK